MRMPSESPIMNKKECSPSWDLIFLLVFVTAGLLHAGFYIFFIPPWYHYDEPSHLEYVLLTANLGRVPSQNERQQDIAQAIGRSMIETGFSDKMGLFPNLNPTEGQITSIGYSQLGGPPLSYLLAAIPVSWYSGDEILVDLQIARTFSALFYLINIVAAWGLARELFPGRDEINRYGSLHFMHIALPAGLALWPAHVDIMTAVNSDPPAIAFSGLALWALTRMIRIAFSEHRLAWGSLLVMLVTSGLAIAFKETAFVLLPAVIFALLFTLLQCFGNHKPVTINAKFRRGFAWVAIALSLLLGVFFTLRNDDAAYWVRLTDQMDSVRNENPLAPHGAFVGKISLNARRFPAWHVDIYQSIAHTRLPASLPANFTFGVWMWADRIMEIDLPTFSIGPVSYSRRVTLTTSPQFFTYLFSLQSYDAPNLRVSLKHSHPSSEPGYLYVDGLILVEGSYSTDQPPVYDDAGASSGEWGGKPFTNILRNGSFEHNGLRFAPWLDGRLASFIPDQSLPSAWLQAAFDWEGFSYYYRDAFLHLFRTFVARFGWGNIPLVPGFPFLGRHPYLIIGYTFLLLVGLTVVILISPMLFHNRTKSGQQDNQSNYPAVLEIAFIFTMTIALGWGMTLMRGSLYTGLSKIYYPVARYALPVVIPSLVALLSGWGILTEALQKRYPKAGLISIIIFLLAMLFLNVISIQSIAAFVAR